jgi:hypothetical protein
MNSGIRPARSERDTCSSVLPATVVGCLRRTTRAARVKRDRRSPRAVTG